jgi:3-phenylpropionate/cinnamic acid dioxygenase small subunit
VNRAEELIEVAALLSRHGQLVDAGRLNDWVELFAAECSYRIVPRENYDRGLPVTLLQCDNRRQLRDRVLSLLEAMKYNIHTDRHVIGMPVIVERTQDLIKAEAPFVVMQADAEGMGALFVFGSYVDELVWEGGSLRFRSKVAVIDNFEIPHALSTPV